jgi:hypothetical protein
MYSLKSLTSCLILEQCKSYNILIYFLTSSHVLLYLKYYSVDVQAGHVTYSSNTELAVAAFCYCSLPVFYYRGDSFVSVAAAQSAPVGSEAFEDL